MAAMLSMLRGMQPIAGLPLSVNQLVDLHLDCRKDAYGRAAKRMGY